MLSLRYGANAAGNGSQPHGVACVNNNSNRKKQLHSLTKALRTTTNNNSNNNGKELQCVYSRASVYVRA